MIANEVIPTPGAYHSPESHSTNNTAMWQCSTRNRSTIQVANLLPLSHPRRVLSEHSQVSEVLHSVLRPRISFYRWAHDGLEQVRQCPLPDRSLGARTAPTQEGNASAMNSMRRRNHKRLSVPVLLHKVKDQEPQDMVLRRLNPYQR